MNRISQRFIFTDAVHETICSTSTHCVRRSFPIYMWTLQFAQEIVYIRIFNSIPSLSLFRLRRTHGIHLRFEHTTERCVIIDFLIDGSMTTQNTQS